MIVKRVTTPLEETVKAEHLACLEKNRVMKICAKKKNEHMNPPLGRADSQKKGTLKASPRHEIQNRRSGDDPGAA
jgi:hypothetical protein